MAFLGSTALVESNFRTIWQVKVEPRLHRPVLALQNMPGTSPQVNSYLLAGVIGGGVFVPLIGRSPRWTPASWRPSSATARGAGTRSRCSSPADHDRRRMVLRDSVRRAVAP